MTHYDYEQGQVITQKGYPFYALIQAAMRQADTDNLLSLRKAFPAVHSELQARYNAPGGLLSDELETIRQANLRQAEDAKGDAM